MNKRSLFKMLNKINYESNVAFGEYIFCTQKMCDLLNRIKVERIHKFFALMMVITWCYLLKSFYFGFFSVLSFNIFVVVNIILYNYLLYIFNNSDALCINHLGENNHFRVRNFLKNGLVIVLFQDEYTYDLPSSVINEFYNSIIEDYNKITGKILLKKLYK